MIKYIVLGVVGGLALILCLCLAVANFAIDNFDEKLKSLDKVGNSLNISTLGYVKHINEKYFDSSIKVYQCEQYRDHYIDGKIGLSSQTMYSNSLASLATVSHELGHARQDREGVSLKKHIKLRKVGRTCGMFFLPLLLIGAVLCLLNLFEILPQRAVLIVSLALMGGAFLIFLFAIILKFREIRIEKQASDYAIGFLKEIFTSEEVKSCKDFLNSARLTYWASLFRTMFSWTHLTQKDKMFR